MSVSWEGVVAYAVGLPAVEESTSYRTPSLKVADKLMCRLRTEADGGMAVKCSVLDQLEELFGVGQPKAYGHATEIGGRQALARSASDH